MRDFTPAEKQEAIRLGMALHDHTSDCPDCAKCCEDELCPVGQKLMKPFLAATLLRQ
jgi:hypothetical protein